MSTIAAGKKAEKSYLSSAVDSINPWGAGKTSKTENYSGTQKSATTTAETASAATDDHSTTSLYGQSFSTYPKDCPPLNVHWFHAVDVRSID
jgi:hypothetical protein